MSKSDRVRTWIEFDISRKDDEEKKENVASVGSVFWLIFDMLSLSSFSSDSGVEFCRCLQKRW